MVTLNKNFEVQVTNQDKQNMRLVVSKVTEDSDGVQYVEPVACCWAIP